MSVNIASYSITQALDPAASVFVSANAGAGKTSLLTSRVLRLLLHGVPPAKILCLTFTNAAAAEMSNRVLAELGKWVMAEDTDLSKALEALTDHPPDDALLARARGLFAHVLEAPEGIRIQTIHGFCQSLLRRFPIEAGISPHFTVMDSSTEQELLQEARLRLFSRAQEEDPALREALAAIACIVSESSFSNLLTEIIKNKSRIRALFGLPDGVNAAIRGIWESFSLPPDTTLQALIGQHFIYDEAVVAQWRRIVRILKHGELAEQAKAQALTDWFACPDKRESLFNGYADIFLTRKGTQRIHLFKKGIIADAGLLDVLKVEQERVWRFDDMRKALEVAHHTTRLLHIAEALLSLYETQKRHSALMDYDDLILAASNLLQKPGVAPWVLFKLDGGIDHVLVDEAQDTSPEQWNIVKALTQEFFAGEGRGDKERSLFVVGDEKQSIFSFQGADPAGLGYMQRYFTQRIRDAAKQVHHIALTRSFRSTREVLAAVDGIFAQGAAKDGLTFDDIPLSHIPTRLDHPGLVELWPLFGNSPPPIGEGISSLTQLARTIADTIYGWLRDGVMLEAKGRRVQAGDIMILVRSRTPLVDRLVRALKRRDIPVAGRDRMRLGDNLAVQDLIALGQCLLLPEDNLTLAALLKSPIFNLNEDDLFQLAWQRGDKSIWERLSVVARSGTATQSSSIPSLAITEAFTLLSDLRAKADYLSPFELYSYLLDTCGARRRFTGRMGEEYHDPIDEFLGQALLYERGHTPSLQGFLHSLASSDSEIRRDMEQAGNSVRIMTVHGAKGLQAPIVILPDTVEPPRLLDSLLWQEREGAPLPFWPVSSTNDDTLCAGLRDEQKQAMLAEYRRLLYVALTRAEDRLYICGATNKDKISEQSWYHHIQTGFTALAEPFEMSWGQGLRLGSVPSRHPERSDASFPVAQDTSTRLRLVQDDKNFSFLTRQAPAEPVPSQPLSPSRLAGEEPAGASPLSQNAIYQRGNFIHRLLQYLSGLPPQERMAAAGAMVASPHTLPENERHECIREALAVMDDPEFAFLFTENSLAEVPVAGSVVMDGKPVAVAGQIDRLFIGEKEVWIVDFKSNRAPPARPEDIPPVYLQQMRLYRLLLEQIYPDKTVICALLWTAEAKMSVLDGAA